MALVKTANINTQLPAEMLEKIFLFFPPGDLKTAVLVCRWWQEVGEGPRFWLWVRLSSLKWSPSTIIEVLKSRRLEGMSQLVVWQVSEELLNAISNHPGLKELLVVADLSSVDPELLVKVVVKMEDIGFRSTYLFTEQVERMFKALSQGSSLKILDIGEGCKKNVLASVEPELFTGIINHLEELNLDHAKIIDLQAQAIFDAIRGSNKLKILRLRFNNLSAVEPEVLAKALNKLEEVDVCGSQLTDEQALVVIRELSENSNLKMLDMGETDLSSVEPGLLARAVNKLEEAELQDTNLSKEQIEAILHLSLEHTSLKRLMIGSWNHGFTETIDQDLQDQAEHVIETVFIE